MHGTYLAHVHGALSGPHGGAVTAGSVITIALAVLATLVVPLAIVLLCTCLPPRPKREDDDDTDSGWGRGGPGGPPAPGAPPPPESGPAWWPEFERQLAAYIEHTRRTEPAVVTPQADWA